MLFWLLRALCNIRDDSVWNDLPQVSYLDVRLGSRLVWVAWRMLSVLAVIRWRASLRRGSIGEDGLNELQRVRYSRQVLLWAERERKKMSVRFYISTIIESAPVVSLNKPHLPWDELFTSISCISLPSLVHYTILPYLSFHICLSSVSLSFFECFLYQSNQKLFSISAGLRRSTGKVEKSEENVSEIKWNIDVLPVNRSIYQKSLSDLWMTRGRS